MAGTEESDDDPRAAPVRRVRRRPRVDADARPAGVAAGNGDDDAPADHEIEAVTKLMGFLRGDDEP